MQKLAVGKLVLDYDLYPRRQVDSQHLAYICQAMEAGCEFPPIVADRKTKRVADGFHRTKAYARVFGDAHVSEVVLKPYRDEAALFQDAIRFNSNHGRALTMCDRTRCLLIANDLKIDKSELASWLHMSLDRLSGLEVDRTAQVGNGNPITVALKRTIKHKSGQRLTKRQGEANNRLSGMNQVFYVNQVIELIEADLLDASDAKLMERLYLLRDLLVKMK